VLPRSRRSDRSFRFSDLPVRGRTHGRTDMRALPRSILAHLAESRTRPTGWWLGASWADRLRSLWAPVRLRPIRSRGKRRSWLQPNAQRLPLRSAGRRPSRLGALVSAASSSFTVRPRRLWRVPIPLNLFCAQNGDFGPSWPSVSKTLGPLSPADTNTQSLPLQRALVGVWGAKVSPVSRRLTPEPFGSALSLLGARPTALKAF